MTLFLPPTNDHPVRRAFNSNPPPRDGLVAHLVHFEETEIAPEYWTIRLYRDNFDSFSGEDRLVIFNWASDTIKSMRVFEPRSYIEVEGRVPR